MNKTQRKFLYNQYNAAVYEQRISALWDYLTKLDVFENYDQVTATFKDIQHYTKLYNTAMAVIAAAHEEK